MVADHPLSLSFNVKNKIITMNESGEIEARRIYFAVRQWEGSSPGMPEDDLVERIGNAELPDGKRTPLTIALKDGWCLSAVGPVRIVNGFLFGRYKNGQSYNPVVKQAREWIDFVPKPAPDESGHFSQPDAESSEEGQGDFVYTGIESITESILKGSKEVTRESGLTVSQDDRIRLSDPSAVPVAKVKTQHENSEHALDKLRKKLDSLHGDDAGESLDRSNTQKVPFSDDELQTLRTVVDAAIALHKAPVVSKPIIDALESIREFLEKARKVLEEAAKTFRTLGGLAGELSKTCLAIKELIDIFRSLPGG